MKNTRIVAFILTAVLSVAGIAVHGTDTDSLKTKIAEADKKIEEAQKKLNAAKAEKASAEKQKNIIDGQIENIVSNIVYVNNQIDYANAQIVQKEEEIVAAQKTLDDNKEYFKKRVITMYKSGSSTYMEMLFSASSISDFFSRVDMLRYVLQNDKKIIDEMTEARDAVVDAKSVIEERKKELVESKAINESQKSKLEVALEQQKAIVAELGENVAVNQKEADAAQREKDSLNEQLERELAGYNEPPGESPAYSGGQMFWPVPAGGTITSTFGYRTYPSKGLHTGLDIAIGMGNTIAAAEAGTVIKVVNGTTGYGKYLMINHGNGTVTLYAHSSKIVVSVGQQVSKGQKIAEIGSTGFSTGPHLHFEVRINGKAVNPIGYIT